MKTSIVDLLMFSEVTKAWRCLENEPTRQKCLDIVEEAEAVVAKRVSLQPSLEGLEYTFVMLFNFVEDYELNLL